MSIFYKALFNDGNSMIYAQKNRILRFLDCGAVEVVFTIPVSWVTSLLMCSRLLTRIFRLGVYRAALHGHVYVVCCGGKLYSYDKITKKLEIELVFEKGRGPLSFCDASNVAGFGDTLYFGEYLATLISTVFVYSNGCLVVSGRPAIPFRKAELTIYIV